MTLPAKSKFLSDRYGLMRLVDMVLCDNGFELTLGRPEDPKGTAKAIREVLAGLKIDDFPQAWHHQKPPRDATGDKPAV
jgi:hypothetical protein